MTVEMINTSFTSRCNFCINIFPKYPVKYNTTQKIYGSNFKVKKVTT